MVSSKSYNNLIINAHSLLRTFFGKLAVANAECCFNAFSVWVGNDFISFFISFNIFYKFIPKMLYAHYGIFARFPVNWLTNSDPLC